MSTDSRVDLALVITGCILLVLAVLLNSTSAFMLGILLFFASVLID